MPNVARRGSVLADEVEKGVLPARLSPPGRREGRGPCVGPRRTRRSVTPHTSGLSKEDSAERRSPDVKGPAWRAVEKRARTLRSGVLPSLRTPDFLPFAPPPASGRWTRPVGIWEIQKSMELWFFGTAALTERFHEKPKWVRGSPSPDWKGWRGPPSSTEGLECRLCVFEGPLPHNDSAARPAPIRPGTDTVQARRVNDLTGRQSEVPLSSEKTDYTPPYAKESAPVLDPIVLIGFSVHFDSVPSHRAERARRVAHRRPQHPHQLRTATSRSAPRSEVLRDKYLWDNVNKVN